MPRAWFIALVALIGVVLAALAATQDGQRAAAPLLPLAFDHADHREVNCIDCHHDYVEEKPLQLCLACHKQDPAVAHLVESQFHDLCRGCHVDEARAGDPHGPPRHCAACHPTASAPPVATARQTSARYLATVWAPGNREAYSNIRHSGM